MIQSLTLISERTCLSAKLALKRQQADPLADTVIYKVIEEGGSKQLRELMKLLTQGSPVPCWSAFHDVDSFMSRHKKLPEWADPLKIKRGSAFFSHHKSTLFYLLGFLALPVSYAAADGVQVLNLSQRLVKDTPKRLHETWCYVKAFGAEDAFSPHGRGFSAALQTRLIHAAARAFAERSGKWRTEWGIPINQEDMAGTNLLFSYVLLKGLTKCGIPFTDEEAEAYIHLWNVISSLAGLDEDLMPSNLQEADRLLLTICERNFRPSPEGQKLTAALIRTLEKPFPWCFQGLIASQMRYLMGDEIADLLAIPNNRFLKYFSKITTNQMIWIFKMMETEKLLLALY